MELVKVPCYSCNSNEFAPYDTENGFQLVKCAHCGLLIVNPRPSETDISKAKFSGVHEGDTTIETTGRYMKRKVSRYFKILKDFYPNGELNKDVDWLDFGCGYGEFMEALKTYSSEKINVKGSELNEIKIKSARKRKLDVGVYMINELNDQYNVISLLNVYSHLPDPVGFFKDIKKLLKPNGELFIETGDTSQLPSKHHHKPYYLPDHLSFANKGIVEGILKNLGFKIIKTKLYRSTLFPRIYSPLEVSIELLKIILNKYGSFKHFFPKHPNRDMFIRCKLI